MKQNGGGSKPPSPKRFGLSHVGLAVFPRCPHLSLTQMKPYETLKGPQGSLRLPSPTALRLPNGRSAAARDPWDVGDHWVFG